MVLSVNTNPGAADGVNILNRVQRDREENNNNISRGIDIDPETAAAAFQIFTNLEGQEAAAQAVRQGQGLAEAATGVAAVAAQDVQGSLQDIRAQTVLAQAGGLSDADRQAIQSNIDGLVQQINSTVATADFNGNNLVDGSQTDLSALASESGERITVTGQALDAAALGIDNLDVTTQAGAQAALASVDGALDTVSAQLAEFGAVQNQFDAAAESATSIANALAEGQGIIADTDLGAASAQRAANDVRGQLSVITTNIANSQPSVVLGLFPGS